MTILINDREAVLTKDCSIDYVSENRYFTDADAYTFAIELPLKNCPQNQKIFGLINRKDTNPTEQLMKCELRAGTLIKRGSIAITEINDISVKVQFLEGRSVQNCAIDFDQVYINELDLGYNTRLDIEGEVEVIPKASWPVSKLANSIDSGQEWQALPWVNNYSGNIQNDIRFDTSPAQWAYNLNGLSYQCYLLALTKRIFRKVGYTYDFSVWERSNFRHLLCCNTLPHTWGVLNYAMALPHWTLTEYIEQLEMLMYCEFDIDHNEKQVSVCFSASANNSAGAVHLTRVLNEYSVTEEEESSNEYKEAKNIKYADCDNEIWKYLSCRWLIDSASRNNYWDGRWLHIYNKATMQDLLNAIPSYYDARGASADDVLTNYDQNIYYVTAESRYYTARRTKVEKLNDGTTSDTGPGAPPLFRIYYYPQALNLFEEKVVDPDADTMEVKIVPAWLDDLRDNSKGLVYFLDCGEYDNIKLNRIDKVLEAGEQQSTEYHDKLYVAFWPGEVVSSKYPHPYIDKVDINTDRTLTRHAYSLVLREPSSVGYQQGATINRQFRYTFKFLSDTLPNVRAVFYIEGKRYLCQKITATLSAETGMSQLMSGEFYEIED